MEYGPIGTDPSFCVVVLDSSTCSPWQTAYGGQFQENDFGNINQNGNGKMRSEYFFQFQQNDSLQLAGMLNMFNQIPNGAFVTVFTPVGYNYQQVNTLAPDLVSFLQNQWDPGVITSESIMVLHGIQGEDATFVADTMLQNDHISFSVPVCDGITGLAEANSQPVIQLLADGTIEVSSMNMLTGIQLMSLSGTVIPFSMEEAEGKQYLIPDRELTVGLYLLSGKLNGELWVERFITSKHL
jgi:hypothetical protein